MSRSLTKLTNLSAIILLALMVLPSVEVFAQGNSENQIISSSGEIRPLGSHDYRRFVIFHDWLTTSPGSTTPNSYATRIANARPQMVVIFTHMWQQQILNLVPAVRDLFHDNGITVLAYVSTQYGNRPLSQVYADIERAMEAGADGIMLDEVPGFMWGSEGQIPHYQQCRDKIKSYGEDKIVYMNTGTEYVSESIMNLADIFGIEHHWQNLINGAPWVVNYPSSRIGACLMQMDDEMPLNYPVTLETAVRDTIDCWEAGHVAWFYSAKIEGEVDPSVPTKWLPDWFEEYTEQIRSISGT